MAWNSKTWEEYKLECEAVAPQEITILGYTGEWEGAKTKLRVYCSLHGEQVGTTISSFKSRGRGCRDCGRLAIKTKKEQPLDYYEQEVVSLLKDTKYSYVGLVGDYVGVHSAIRCVCPKHGEWNSTFAKIRLKGSRCNGCAIDFNAERSRKSLTYFEDRCKNKIVPPNILNHLTPQEGLSYKLAMVSATCPVHGVWEEKVESFLARHGGKCPTCKSLVRGRRKTEKMHIEDCRQVLPEGQQIIRKVGKFLG